MYDVSIIIGCFMQEKYVDQAFWSAKNQDYDDGSIEVIIRHDNCDTGQGTSASHSRNHAIERAKGKWIICLDADDMLPMNYVSALMTAMNKNDCFVGCPVQFISGRTLARFCTQEGGLYGPEDMAQFETVPVPVSAMFPKEAWAAAGGFDENLKTLEDWDFWWSLIQHGYLYQHTEKTCLLKTNDGMGKVHRMPTQTRQETIKHMNRKYGTKLVLPVTIK